MSYTQIPPSNLKIIDVGTESNTWGGLRNQDFQTIAGELKNLYDYRVAGEDLNRYTIVGVNNLGEVIKADSTDSLFKENILGITLESALNGANILVRFFGVITEAGWNWNSGAVFFDSNGVLTQDESQQTAFRSVVARVLSSNTIRLQIENSTVAVDEAVLKYKQSFQDIDLSSGVLTATHNLNELSPEVHIYDNNSQLIGCPDKIQVLSANGIDIDLSSFSPITGTWLVEII